MLSSFFKSFFYLPLYNALVALTNLVPGGNIGVAIILLTIIVRLLILPISHRAIRTQRKMKELEGEIKTIQERYKKNKEEQAKQTMALYREHKINPFSSVLSLLIQIPIIFALYRVFLADQSFDPSLLYSFINLPETVNHIFLGIDLTAKSYTLAVLAGLSQFFQTRLMMPKDKKEERKSDGPPSFKEQFAKSMNLQMKYFLPILIVFISFGLPSAVVLYWVASNLFMIAHELLVRRSKG